MNPAADTDFEVILGNSNKRFSGVTSTMLQTLEHQRKAKRIRVLGQHHLPQHLRELAISFFALARVCRKPLANGAWRVFHARRNDEIIQALLLKFIFRAKIRIVFTSTAQRHHSRFTRFLMSKCDKVISTCSAAASYLDPAPSAIVPHGIDTQTYAPSQESNGETIEVGIFGRVRAQKGTDIFVKAAVDVFKDIPNVNATIVGAIAPDQEAFADTLKQTICEAGLAQRIRFTGELPFEDIPPLFRRMNLVAALSLNEGYGLTVLEALSSGAAVLASKAGAWPDIVTPGIHGDIVDTGDVKTTSIALRTLLQDKTKLEHMGKAGRNHVLKHYKIEQEAEQLCDIYTELSAQPSSTYR